MENAKSLTLQDISTQCNASLIGDGSTRVQGICRLDEPLAGHVAFTNVNDAASLIKTAEGTPLAGLIVKEHLLKSIPESFSLPVLGVKNPQQAALAVVKHFHPYVPPSPGISEKADIAESAKLGEGVHVAAFTSIAENVSVGSHTIIYPHCVIYPNVSIGQNCIIHAGAIIREGTHIGDNCRIQNGAVIGADGFGYVPDAQGNLQAVPQVGVVRLADAVDVGANACIDRAALGSTRIGHQSKIDNLVQVGHNVEVGSRSILCGQVGVGGSSKIGNGVTLAGQVGVADHVVIVDGVRIGGHSAADRSVTEKGDYMGFPLMKAMSWKRLRASVELVPDLIKRCKRSLSA